MSASARLNKIRELLIERKSCSDSLLIADSLLLLRSSVEGQRERERGRSTVWRSREKKFKIHNYIDE